MIPVNCHLFHPLSWSPVPRLWLSLASKTQSSGHVCYCSSTQWSPTAREQRPLLSCCFFLKLASYCFFTLWSPSLHLCLGSLLTLPIPISCSQHPATGRQLQQFCVLGSGVQAQPLSWEGCRFLLGTSKSAMCPLLILPPTSSRLPGLELLEDLSLGFGHSHVALAAAAHAQYISKNQPSLVDTTIFMPVYLPCVCPRSEPGFYSSTAFPRTCKSLAMKVHYR